MTINDSAKLNQKQRRFIEALANGATYSQAYLVGYPNSRKWTSTARSANAARLLRNPIISESLEKRRRELQEIERERDRWTRERTIRERMRAIESIRQEMESRQNAIRAEAETLINNPPVDMSPERVLIEVQRVLQKSANSIAANGEIVRICESLDRITGLTTRSGEAADSPVIVLKDEDVDE